MDRQPCYLSLITLKQSQVLQQPSAIYLELLKMQEMGGSCLHILHF